MTKLLDLPQEIRDVIWAHVVRPEWPGAHYFAVQHNPKKAGPAKSSQSVTFTISNDISDDGIFGATLPGFAVPRSVRAAGQPAWTQGNPSIYTQDSALWSLSRGSREYMNRMLRPARARKQCMREQSRKMLWLSLRGGVATATAELRGSPGGGRQYFTIQPSKDLIIIQMPLPFPKGGENDSSNNKPSPPISDLWTLSCQNALIAWNAPFRMACAPRNIAFEFDPDPNWWPCISEYLRKGFRRDFAAEEVGTIWLVDYRLERGVRRGGAAATYVLDPDSWPEGWQPTREPFYARDRRFVEVRDVCRGWYVWNEAEQRPSNSPVFLARIHMQDCVDQWAFRDAWGIGPILPVPEVKVLACELL